MLASSPLLEVEDLHVSYGKIRAVQGVSLAVPEAAVVALIGANGAGKTTLLRAISGVVRPRQGAVRFGGEDLVGLPVHQIVRRRVVQVPEGRGMLARMTVLENLQLGAFTRRDEAEPALERAFTLFPRLRERRGQLAGSLSGGEQQMLAIVRAMMARPRLLMLDEPSLGLAPLLVREIIDDALPNRDLWLLALAVGGSVLVDLTARLIGVGVPDGPGTYALRLASSSPGLGARMSVTSFGRSIDWSRFSGS